MEKKSKKVSINAEFHTDFESVEKVVKKCTKKSYKQNKFDNMSKGEKSAYFLHVFANNIFLLHFFKTFSMDSKSALNSAFFDTHIEFLEKNFCSY